MPDENPSDKIRGLLSSRKLGHDANQLLVDIMERWGGTASFASDLYSEFQQARPGSLIRQNILEMIQKLVVNNTNHNITRIVDPSDLDDDEIEVELASAIRRASEFKDGPAEPEPATHTARWQVEDPPVEGDVGDGRGGEWDWDDRAGAAGDPP